MGRNKYTFVDQSMPSKTLNILCLSSIKSQKAIEMVNNKHIKMTTLLVIREYKSKYGKISPHIL